MASGGLLNGSSLMGTSRLDELHSLANSEAGTYREAYTSPSPGRANQSFQSGRGLAPIVETPSIGFGNDFAIKHMMNKTGPNFMKSTRNVGLDDSLESEMLDEMNDYPVSKRGFPHMPSISTAGMTTGRMDP